MQKIKPSPPKSTARREREFAQREAAIVEAARRILQREGFEGVSMGRIADELEYARGTMYLHFVCKEEVILAVGIRAQELRLSLMDRVSSMPGNARERFVAAGEVIRVVSPRYTRGEMLIYMDGIREKVRPEFCTRMYALEGDLFRKGAQIVQEAIESGDFTLPEGLTPQDFTYVHWANIYGAMCISNSGAQLQGLGVDDPREVAKTFGRTYLDALGWRPLSSEFDYRETMRRIYRDVITPDVAALFRS
jgi:AcrR family transcriptional regulator